MSMLKSVPIALIAAVARHGAIGHRNQLLVHLPGDLPRFKQLTLGHPVIMGRKTFESIGKPLPGRRNIVLTRDRHWRADGVEAVSSLDAALQLAHGALRAFIIGGAEIYALALPRADELLLTEIDAEFDADAFFPDWPRDAFERVADEARSTAQGLQYRYATYRRINGDSENV